MAGKASGGGRRKVIASPAFIRRYPPTVTARLGWISGSSESGGNAGGMGPVPASCLRMQPAVRSLPPPNAVRETPVDVLVSPGLERNTPKLREANSPRLHT